MGKIKSFVDSGDSSAYSAKFQFSNLLVDNGEDTNSQSYGRSASKDLTHIYSVYICTELN